MKKLLLSITLLLLTYFTYGQSMSLDSVKSQRLNFSDELAKCIFFDSEGLSDERQAHEMIWNLKSVRNLANGMLNIGTYMETLTVTLNKPTDKSKYFIVALYNRQPRVINKLMIYRVDLNEHRIERRYDSDNEWTIAKD